MVRVAIIGFGMMGCQIAQVFAQYGHDVIATDTSPEALTTGVLEVQNGPYGLKAAVSRGKLTAEDAEKASRRIRTTPDIREACKAADVVIEAAIEELKLKQELFRKLDRSSPTTAILASNTSTLSIGKIAEQVDHKERMLGMHFFNPAQVTKLVEIVRTDQTSQETARKASEIVRGIGKTDVTARDEPGFIANRLGLTLYVEASRLLEEGVSTIRDIDNAMRLGYGHSMGPFETADTVGLDTRLRNLESLYQATGDARWLPPKILRQMVNKGYLGNPSRKRNSKGGYYEFYNIQR